MLRISSRNILTFEKIVKRLGIKTRYFTMIMLEKLGDAPSSKHARYFTLNLDKAYSDAPNVCRVSPRVGVVTVVESFILIGC